MQILHALRSGQQDQHRNQPQQASSAGLSHWYPILISPSNVEKSCKLRRSACWKHIVERGAAKHVPPFVLLSSCNFTNHVRLCVEVVAAFGCSKQLVEVMACKILFLTDLVSGWR